MDTFSVVLKGNKAAITSDDKFKALRDGERKLVDAVLGVVDDNDRLVVSMSGAEGTVNVGCVVEVAESAVPVDGSGLASG